MKETIVTDAELLGDLFYGFAQALGGSRLDDDELIKLANDTFVEKPFCIVRQWMLLDVILPEAMDQKIKTQGLKSVLLYAQSVVFDSHGQHGQGDSVLSDYERDSDGCIFESSDTIFILAGQGSRKHASLPAVQALITYRERA